jgi:hypothetical protein
MKGKRSGKKKHALNKARRAAQRANARTIRKAAEVVDAQQRVANTRAKYGPRMGPAPVIVKRIERDGD